MSTSEVPSSPFHPDLIAGQVAFVTGGATGIGKEICRVLGHHGARIAIASRKQEALDAAAEELRSESIEVWIRSCDVRDAPGVRETVEGLVDHYGRLDIVVNNAAGNFPVPIANMSPNGFKSVVDIDLLGTYNVSKAAFDVWLGAHGGNVVNITAPYEMKGAALQAHVAAAKAGVDSLDAHLRGRVGYLMGSGSTRSHPGRSPARRVSGASPPRCPAPPVPTTPRRGRESRHGRVTRWAWSATVPTSPTCCCTCAAPRRGSCRARSSRSTARGASTS